MPGVVLPSSGGRPTGLPGGQLDINSPEKFAIAVLRVMRITPNPENVRALIAWQKIEGGAGPQFGIKNNTASYNPLNTTKDMGSGSRSVNSAGVKAYGSWDQGIDATVQTLNQYPSIVAALRHGTADQVGRAVATSKWGTGRGLLDTLSSVPRLTQKQVDNSDDVGNLSDIVTAPINAAGDVVSTVGDVLGLITSPAFWLRVLLFIGGLVIGFFALKQLAAAGGTR